MGGPAQINGPDSPKRKREKKTLGRPRPTINWADLGPTKNTPWSGPDPTQITGLGQNHSGPPQKYFWARTRLAERRKNNAGPASAWPSKHERGEGIIFPPHLLHAETILHAGGKLMQL